MSNSLQPHELQHSRLPCLSLSPRVCYKSCALSWWWHPTISSSVTPFSSCPQSFPAWGYFPMSWLFTSGGQSIGAWSLLCLTSKRVTSPPHSAIQRLLSWVDQAQSSRALAYVINKVPKRVTPSLECNSLSLICLHKLNAVWNISSHWSWYKT